MVTNISHSPAETESLGEAWGRGAAPGWVIALSGDLGAGKTQLVKGLARGLGFPGRVHSPTFALVNAYEGGRLSLFHLDLYRLETREQIHSAGLEDYLQPDGVTVIEWAERWLELPPFTILQPPPMQTQPHALRLRWARLEGLNETERRIEHEDFGA